MAKVHKMARIDNAQPTFITLPQVKGFPSYVLTPGGGLPVPMDYLEAIDGGPKGPKVFMASMVARKFIRVTTADSPKIKEALAAPETPNPPSHLDGIASTVALVLIGAEDDAETLRTWRQGERRPDLVSAIDARLISLVPAPVVTPAFTPTPFNLNKPTE